MISENQIINEPTMQEDNMVEKFLTDKKYFIETAISIKDKDRFIVPFVFNPIQTKFYDSYVELNKKGIRKHIILKPRQLGFTTLVCALFLSECIQVPNTTAAIIAHDAESTARIFEITKLMWEKLPEEIRPAAKRSSKRELVFESLNSKIFIGTAGSTGFGRGTTINLLHCSEFAFWEKPEEILPSLLETVPKENGIVIYETTANGYNHFHDSYIESKESTEMDRKLNQIAYPHFFRWFDHPEYRFDLEEPEVRYLQDTLTKEEEDLLKAYNIDLEQLAWRRSKKASLKDKFLQEYPEDDQTCFIASGKPFFDREIVKGIKVWIEQNKVSEWSRKELNERITIFKNFQPNQKYILCADPAEGNPLSDASSAFILRLNMNPIFVEFCAQIHDRYSMPNFYKLLYHLGSLYRFPSLAIERNNHGHLLNYWAVNGFFQDQIKLLSKYPRVYTATDGKAGFVTSPSVRPLVLDNLAELLRNNMLVVYSSIWLDQALSFVYNDSGRPEAQRGKLDDAIIASAIGCFLLVHEKNTQTFSFINKEEFGRAQQPQSTYDQVKARRLEVGYTPHPTEHNIQDYLVGDPEIIDYRRFMK